MRDKKLQAEDKNTQKGKGSDSTSQAADEKKADGSDDEDDDGTDDRGKNSTTGGEPRSKSQP